MRRFFKVLFSVIVILVLVVLINFIPTISLGTKDMGVFVGDWVNVYYEEERDAARDTFDLAEERAGELAELLNLDEEQKIDIYIYDDQKTMQRKKYGFIIPFLALDWYIGDNIGTDVILTSPARPGKAHDYHSIKNAVLHEIVHAYNYVINKDMTYWVDNGIAGYLSNQDPGDNLFSYSSIPTLGQTQVDNLIAPIIFSNFGGYAFSYSYIEYLDKTYSWESISSFARRGDFEECFGASEEEIYDDWVYWLMTGG